MSGTVTLQLPTPSPSASRCVTPTQYHLTHLPDRPPVDIEFSDLSYSVPDHKGSKLILRSVSGLFKSGHLTAILGPSGAGKSTLLNVLAGYKCSGATGTILTNNQPRDLKIFHKLSRYIMQEDLLQPFLTVQENMEISANLKLGNGQSTADKALTIDEILTMLRLSGTRHTMTSRLSGGERKRLSIALELVNNPPVIFLDEPTTGLDDLSSSMCIHLLKMLAQTGRTVICSVHTPSAKLFNMFDHVYIVSQGVCVYQGQSHDVVPFLKTINLHCPTTHNPADYVIEIASGEHGNYTEAMSTSIENGKIFRWNRPDSNRAQPLSITTPIQNSLSEYNFSSSGWSQFVLLLKRMLLQQGRDTIYLLIKLMVHVVCGIIVGGMFWKMGNDGSKTLFNIGYCFLTLIAVLYIPLLPILLSFPFEVQLLKREYFNRWYGLTPFFCAFTVSRLPSHIACTSIFIGISYVMTGQPLEINRFALFLVLLLIVAWVSESFGMIIGSVMNIINGMFIGPALCVPIMLFSVYGLSYNRPVIPLHMQLLMKLSYLRYGLEGLLLAIYGYDREDMTCPDDYCHYKSPRNVLTIAGMENCSIWVDFTALIFMLLLFRIISFTLLRWRLSPSSRIAAIQKVARLVKSNILNRRSF